MAAGQFVKTAAAQLRRASMVLKQEAQVMLSERERTARRLSSEITNHQAQLRGKQLEANNSNKSDYERRLAVAEMHKLQAMIDQKQRQMDTITRNLAEAANVKKSKANNFDVRAHDLESQASYL